MWDSSSSCGWGHASTTDFLRYTHRGCTGLVNSFDPQHTHAVTAQPQLTPHSLFAKTRRYCLTSSTRQPSWCGSPHLSFMLTPYFNCHRPPRPLGVMSGSITIQTPGAPPLMTYANNPPLPTTLCGPKLADAAEIRLRKGAQTICPPASARCGSSRLKFHADTCSVDESAPSIFKVQRSCQRWSPFYW